MFLKLTRVDPLSFADHYYLAQTDVCYHFGEYTPKRGYSFSPTNSLINNLKKKPSTASPNELRYKERAIGDVSNLFLQVINSEANKDKLMAATLVPIPPSAIRGDPLFDDRMTRVISTIGIGLNLDIRELVEQHQSVPPAHEGDVRPTLADVIENYYIEEAFAEPTPRVVWIFDDLLTAGCHYKAMQTVIQRRFPGVPTAGFFVARRVPEPEELLGLDQL